MPFFLWNPIPNYLQYRYISIDDRQSNLYSILRCFLISRDILFHPFADKSHGGEERDNLKLLFRSIFFFPPWIFAIDTHLSPGIEENEARRANKRARMSGTAMFWGNKCPCRFVDSQSFSLFRCRAGPLKKRNIVRRLMRASVGV